ncbi:MAG TPA: two-component sensor histidine kinase, partial [Methylophaga sp.]|nr:two-component sensor histidine kinase [Methylophaga sp.]
MKKNYLDVEHESVAWMLNQKNDALKAALDEVKQAQKNFDGVAKINIRMATQLRLAENVLLSYKNLAAALHRDSEIKISVIALLNVISLLFLYSCIIAIMLGAKSFLVERMDRLQTFLMLKFPAQKHEPNSDEFTRLEQRIFEMTA